MQGPNISGRVMGGKMVRKKRPHTWPWPEAVENQNSVLPPLPEDEDLPATKKARLQAPTNISTAALEDAVVMNAYTADIETTGSPDDTPTYPVTPEESLTSAATSLAPRHWWKSEEDAKLVEAVKKHGHCWVAVATMVPGRTNHQCLQRWKHNLDPANGKRGRWSSEEDAELIKAVQKLGNQWVEIAATVPGRTDAQCRGRWLVLDPTRTNGNQGNSRRSWKPEEDAMLMEELTEVVNKHGNEWVVVASKW